MVDLERKKEVIDLCLDLFVKKGVYETTTRELSKALNLQTAGIYYYFSSKDDVVIACAEEAALRLEKELIIPAMFQLTDPDLMMKNLKGKADEMSPMMKFLITVSSCNKYNEKLQPVLQRASSRYDLYAKNIAEKLNCKFDIIAPYLYMCITATTNYMIFNDESYIEPQIDLIKNALIRIKKGELK